MTQWQRCASRVGESTKEETIQKGHLTEAIMEDAGERLMLVGTIKVSRGISSKDFIEYIYIYIGTTTII